MVLSKRVLEFQIQCKLVAFTNIVTPPPHLEELYIKIQKYTFDFLFMTIQKSRLSAMCPAEIHTDIRYTKKESGLFPYHKLTQI